MNDEMRKYRTNTCLCRRNLLFKDFLFHLDIVCEPLCKCCDVCMCICNCNECKPDMLIAVTVS